jgi:hypothetical protein
MAKVGLEHFHIELIETCPCSSKDELLAKEGEWIRKLGTLNIKVAGRTSQGWYEDNKEKCAEKSKVYHQNNREALKVKAAEWRANNSDKLKEYDKKRYEGERQEIAKARTKQWREDNLEQAREQGRQWREKIKKGKGKWIEYTVRRLKPQRL